jgi:predicted RNA polymerase sigma factor
MVTLNRAIAAAMVHGPAKGLELRKALDSDPGITGHYRLDAVRAHLFEKMDDHEAAIRHCPYNRADGGELSASDSGSVIRELPDPAGTYLSAVAAGSESP